LESKSRQRLDNLFIQHDLCISRKVTRNLWIVYNKKSCVHERKNVESIESRETESMKVRLYTTYKHDHFDIIASTRTDESLAFISVCGLFAVRLCATATARRNISNRWNSENRILFLQCRRRHSRDFRCILVQTELIYYRYEQDGNGIM